MSNTLIDQAVQAFVDAISTTPGVTGVYEDRAQAYTHDDAPAIEVTLQTASGDVLGDMSPSRSHLKAIIEVDMAIYTRSAVNASGVEVSSRALASPIWADAHALLMADPSLGGKALRVRWRRSAWRKDNADGTAGWAVHSYELMLALREQTLLSIN